MQTSPELTDDARYSQVSPAAVIALVLGLASPLAFIVPAFFAVPVAAAGAGLLALGKIRRSEGALSGATLARLGIGLALACTAAALVRGSVRDALLQQQAVEAAETWFALLADGRTGDALDVLSGDAASSLVPPPEMGVAPIPPEEAKLIALERIAADPVSRRLAGGAKPKLESVSQPAFAPGKTVVVATFMLGDPASGSHQLVQVQMARGRQFENEGRPWRVDRWNLGETHAAHGVRE